MAFFLSLVAWTALGVAALAELSGADDDPAFSANLILVSMAINGLLSCADQKPAAEQQRAAAVVSAKTSSGELDRFGEQVLMARLPLLVFSPPTLLGGFRRMGS